MLWGREAGVGRLSCDRTILAAHREQNDPLCGRRTAHQARLEAGRSRARCMIVGEGLKEEIAGERGPWRACQLAHDEMFWSSRRVSPADGTMVYLD